MENILKFVSGFGNFEKLVWIFFWMLIFFGVENIIPMIKEQKDKLLHARTNFVFLGTTILINAIFGIVTAGIFIWQTESQVGFLHYIDLPIIVEFFISLMILDLIAQYFVHFLLHKVKFMWKFHMVHHSDTAVDVTTGTRHHPGDYVMRETFSLLSILICGMPFSYYLTYRLITVFCTYFSHANIKLPIWLENILSYIIITPSMHKIHHHFERPYTDSNYGNIFSFWDRIFGTYEKVDASKIVYGLDVTDEQYSNNLEYQMKLPFNNAIKTDY